MNAPKTVQVESATSRLSCRQCRDRIDALQRFADLVRHHQRWAPQMPLARPLDELIPEDTPPAQRHEVIEREIRRLIPSVTRALKAAGVATVFRRQKEEMAFDWDKGAHRPKEIVTTHDVIRDYFNLPKGDSRERVQYFDLVLGAVEEGVGYYQDELNSAIRRRWNPLHWLGWVLSLPIRLLEEAGLKGEEMRSVAATVYTWVVKLGLLLLLGLGAAKLGVSIPWDKLASLLGK